jgi:hypothetical protein
MKTKTMPKVIAPCRIEVDINGSVIDEHDCVSNDQGKILIGHIEISFKKESLGWVMIKDHGSNSMKTYDSRAFSEMLRIVFLEGEN